jgi:VanZ family protein
MNRITIFLILSCIGIIFYFSWLPNGKFGNETYLPAALLAWSNTYFNLRTALPFIVLGMFLSVRNKAKVAFTYCMVVVCVAEGGQFYMPERNPDGMDVLFAALGSVVGIGIVPLLRRTRSAKPREEQD